MNSLVNIVGSISKCCLWSSWKSTGGGLTPSSVFTSLYLSSVCLSSPNSNSVFFQVWIFPCKAIYLIKWALSWLVLEKELCFGFMAKHSEQLEAHTQQCVHSQQLLLVKPTWTERFQNGKQKSSSALQEKHILLSCLKGLMCVPNTDFKCRHNSVHEH